MPAKNATRTPKPNCNPHEPGTDLARGYDEGWRAAHMLSEEFLDHLTESLAGARWRHEGDAYPTSRRRDVIDVDTLCKWDRAREVDRGGISSQR